MQLRRLNIVITGAASGIGKALLKELHKEGNRIFAVDKKPVATIDSTMVRTAEMDLSEPDSTERLLEQAQSFFGPIDLFFSNAGFSYYESFGSFDWDSTAKIFQVNVFSPMTTFSALIRNQPNHKFRLVINAVV